MLPATPQLLQPSRRAIAPSGGGGSPSITITDKTAVHGGFAPIAPFNMAVGSYNPVTDDLFLISGDEQVVANGGAMTIGGVSASKIEANATDQKTIVWMVARGSGVTVSGGNVSVAPFSGNYGSFNAIVGYVHGTASSTPTSHATSAYSFFTSGGISLASQVVASNGVAVAFWWNAASASDLPATWSGFARVSTSEASQTPGSGSASESSGATEATAGTYTVGVTNTGGAMAVLAFA